MRNVFPPFRPRLATLYQELCGIEGPLGMARRNFGLAATVTAAYAIFGFIWIAASDALVEALVADMHTLVVVAMWKGWIFVAASSALIFVLVRSLSARLDASEARHRLMFAESPVPMLVFDTRTLALTDANRAVCDFLGYRVADLIGKPLVELYSPDDRPALEQRMPEILAGIPARGVWRLIRKDGKLADVEAAGRSVALGSGEMRVVALTDIGQRRKAETQLLESLDQLTTANQRLRDIDHAISHELQEPCARSPALFNCWNGAIRAVSMPKPTNTSPSPLMGCAT